METGKRSTALGVDDVRKIYIFGIVPITNGEKMEAVSIRRRGSRQKNAVAAAVCSLSSHPTADEVFSTVRREMPGISLSTVYRNLGILVEEGELLALAGPGGEVHYDHRTGEHCHVQCRFCGRVCDVNMEPVDFTSLHPTDLSGFEIDEVSVTFTGICDKCRYERKEKSNES